MVQTNADSLGNSISLENKHIGMDNREVEELQDSRREAIIL